MTYEAPRWVPKNPDYEKVVRAAFDAQPPMAMIGATLGRVEPGLVEIHLSSRPDLMTHYSEYMHGGTLAMIADSAMGFAALSLTPPGGAGVTIEFKINMLAPASGDRFVARGEIIKAGKIPVARAELYAVKGAEEKIVASAMGTFFQTT